MPFSRIVSSTMPLLGFSKYPSMMPLSSTRSESMTFLDLLSTDCSFWTISSVPSSFHRCTCSRNHLRTSSELVRNQSIIGFRYVEIDLTLCVSPCGPDASNGSLFRKHLVDRTVLYRYYPLALSVGAFIPQQTLLLQSRHHLLHG